MSENMIHFVQNIAALVGLLAVTIVFAAIHDSAHAGEALAAFVGYAAGSRSGPRGVTPLVAAGIVAVAFSVGGCGGGFTPGMLVKPTCIGARLIAHTCDLVDPLETESLP